MSKVPYDPYNEILLRIQSLEFISDFWSVNALAKKWYEEGHILHNDYQDLKKMMDAWMVRKGFA